MRYFFDTEFIENGTTIDLISIGILAEDGRTLYKQNSECVFSKASDWVWRNVFPHLLHFNLRGDRGCNPFTEKYDSGLATRTRTACIVKSEQPCPWATRREIKESVLDFCDVEKYGTPEFWGYYADYDWVAFCQLFGTMMDLPPRFPMYCRDVKQFCDFRGNPEIPKPDVEIHHALMDAQWVQEAHKFLTELP